MVLLPSASGGRIRQKTLWVNSAEDLTEVATSNQRPPAELGIRGWPLEGAGSFN